MDYASLLEQVIPLVKSAADHFFSAETMEVKAKGRTDFVTQVDYQISEQLCSKLPEMLPGSRVISEEAENDGGPDDGYCWIIDPVDGTANMIYGLPLFTISVGLLYRKEPVLGVVYNPMHGEVFHGAKGLGAWRDGKAIHVCNDSRVARTLVLAETNPYADRLQSKSQQVIGEVFRECIDYRVTGSAALDICYIASGRGGAFLAESLSAWDYAGGCAILSEAGGHFCDWTEKPLNFSGTQSFLATNAHLHTEMLEIIKRATD